MYEKLENILNAFASATTSTFLCIKVLIAMISDTPLQTEFRKVEFRHPGVSENRGCLKRCTELSVQFSFDIQWYIFIYVQVTGHSNQFYYTINLDTGWSCNLFLVRVL